MLLSLCWVAVSAAFAILWRGGGSSFCRRLFRIAVSAQANLQFVCAMDGLAMVRSVRCGRRGGCV